jgi:hypothetical protein
MRIDGEAGALAYEGSGCGAIKRQALDKRMREKRLLRRQT